MLVAGVGERDGASLGEPVSAREQEPVRVGEEGVVGQSVVVDRRAVALDDGDVDEAAAQERERVLGIGGPQR